MAPNPGSAIQDDFDTELESRRCDICRRADRGDGTGSDNEEIRTMTGDREFSVELTAQTDDLIVGFNDKATITILDTESSSKEALQTLVDEGTAAEPEWYVEGWEAYAAAVAEGAAVLEKSDATADEIANAISAITEAKAGLTAREQYTAEDPFVFPWRQDSSSTLEAEFSQLHNEELASDGQWALQVADSCMGKQR